MVRGSARRVASMTPAGRQPEAPEPYRVLFPIGVACGLIGAGVWPLQAVGLLPWPGPLHRALMMPAFETAFVVGFLLTSMPAFTHGPKCRPRELAAATAAMLIVAIAALLGQAVLGEAASLAALATVVIALATRALRAGQPPPEEYRFVAFGLLAGLAGAALRLALALGAPLDLPVRFAERLTSLGMVLSLVLGLGGLLVPTFAGLPEPLAIPGIAAPHERRGRRELYLAAIGVLALAFVLEAFGQPRAGAIARAGCGVALVMLVWKPWRLPARRTPAASSLWLSGWLIAVGLVAAALMPGHEIAALHLVFLVGFALLTLGVATRVVVSHGRAPLATESLLLPRPMLVVMLLALAARLVAEWAGTNANAWLGASGVLWCVAWAWWGTHTLRLIIGSSRSSAGPAP